MSSASHPSLPAHESLDPGLAQTSKLRSIFGSGQGPIIVPRKALQSPGFCDFSDLRRNWPSAYDLNAIEDYRNL